MSTGGAQFGTRTICPEAQECTKISGNVSSCRATATGKIMAAVDSRQQPLHKGSKREVEEDGEEENTPQQTGRRLKRAAEAAEL